MVAEKQRSFDQVRKYPRISFEETPWAMSLLDQKLDTLEHPIRLEAKNISLGGLKFLSNQKLPLFQAVRIHFFEKGIRAEPILVSGQIIRVEETDTGQGEKTYGLAVEFKSLDQAALDRLARVLPRAAATKRITPDTPPKE